MTAYRSPLLSRLHQCAKLSPMNKRKFSGHIYTSIIMLSVLFTQPSCATGERPGLRVPAGFQIERLNFSVPNARQMALTEKGTLIVGTRRKTNVYAVPNALSSANPTVIRLVDDLLLPSGVAVQNGDLYIAALNQIVKIPAIDDNLREDPPRQIVTDSLPDKTHHGWKYVKFGPDRQLYVPVGAPCNLCLSDDPRFGTILRMNPSDGSTQIWASGVRNSVGLAWHPVTSDMWFSDNGRDYLGDDVPPEEINISSKAGQHFGFPFVHAGDIDDPEFGDHAQRKGKTFTPPRHTIQAHSAVLGMAFYTGDKFPPAYHHALFVAEHGSWNRPKKVGYRVGVITQTADGSLQYMPFAEGWLFGQEPSGRPNDVLVTPSGDLLISDDALGVIYRVSYLGSKPN